MLVNLSMACPPRGIQRLRSGTWRTIDSDQTNDDGIYREPIPDRRGRYRAVAVREELNAGRGRLPTRPLAGPAAPALSGRRT